MDRRRFLKGLLGVGAALGAAAFVPITVPEELPEEWIEGSAAGWSGTVPITDVHVDKTLTDISVAYLQEQEGFLADKVFPTTTSRSFFRAYYPHKQVRQERVLELCAQKFTCEDCGKSVTVAEKELLSFYGGPEEFIQLSLDEMGPCIQPDPTVGYFFTNCVA